MTFGTRGRGWLAGAIAAALVASLAAVLLRPMLERAVRERIESAAVRHGMVCRIGSVRVGVMAVRAPHGFDLDLGHGVRLHADMIAATYPGRLRLAVRAANLVGPAGLKVSSPITAWYVAGIRGEDLQLTLIEPQAGLSIRQLKDSAGNGWDVEARGLDIGHLFDVRREGYAAPRWWYRGRQGESSDERRCAPFPRRHRRARCALRERWRTTTATNHSSAMRRT